MERDCPFCSASAERIAFKGELFIALWDGFPVTKGHLLLIPQRHTPAWGDLGKNERIALTQAIGEAQRLLRERFSPDGFNVGFNEGAAGGQTVPHFHIHVMPRYSGDVPDPRGGVRHVIPTKANYLKEQTAPEAFPQRLVRGGDDHFLPHLVLHMDRADTCDIAVAFLLDSGARLLSFWNPSEGWSSRQTDYRCGPDIQEK